MADWPLPADESARMENLRSFFILDSQSDENFDRITRLASQMLGLPVALISLPQRDRCHRGPDRWIPAPPQRQCRRRRAVRRGWQLL